MLESLVKDAPRVSLTAAFICYESHFSLDVVFLFAGLDKLR